MRKTAFAQTVKYGSSDNVTDCTALSPYQLYNGSIGIYGILKSDGIQYLLNTDRADGTGFKRITSNTATDNTGFLGYQDITIWQGQSTASSSICLGTYNVSDMVSLTAKAYTAPVAQVTYVGYNSSTAAGSLNLPTIVNNDTASISYKVIPATVNPIMPNTQVGDAGTLVSTATGYTILAAIAQQFNTITAAQRVLVAEIVGTGTSAAVTADTTGSAVIFKVAAGTPTVTGVVTDSGSVSKITYSLSASTFSATQTVAVGDYIQIDGTIYKIAAQDFTTSSAAYVMTLDRKYQGAALSSTAASHFKLFSVAPTTSNWGMRATAYVAGTGFTLSVLDNLQNATIVYQTGATVGIGTYAQANELEKMYAWHRGNVVTEDNPNNNPIQYFAVSTATYDTYSAQFKTSYMTAIGSDTNNLSGTTNWYFYFFCTDKVNTQYNNQKNIDDLLNFWAVAAAAYTAGSSLV